MQISGIATRVGKFAADNSPAILSGLAVTGTLATAYLTGKASFKASQIIREDLDRPTARDKVEATWKLYIPPASSAIATIACVILANRIGNRRAAALAAAYAISEKAFVEYKDKVIEKIGEKKEQAVRDEVQQDRVKQNPFNDIFIVGEKEVLCFDSYTGRYFLSDMETLKKAQNDINYRVLHDYYASLSEFYNMIGLPTTSFSDNVGWNADKLLELEFSAVLADTNRPCIAIDFRVEPVHGYSRLQ